MPLLLQVLTDVTLACGGRVFETHKIMLCVCSAFFRQVLTGRQSNKHPIVFLKDIRPKHLEQLLQYMYNGEINVLQVREVSCSAFGEGIMVKFWILLCILLCYILGGNGGH